MEAHPCPGHLCPPRLGPGCTCAGKPRQRRCSGGGQRCPGLDTGVGSGDAGPWAQKSPLQALGLGVPGMCPHTRDIRMLPTYSHTRVHTSPFTCMTYIDTPRLVKGPDSHLGSEDQKPQGRQTGVGGGVVHARVCCHRGCVDAALAAQGPPSVTHRPISKQEQVPRVWLSEAQSRTHLPCRLEGWLGGGDRGSTASALLKSVDTQPHTPVHAHTRMHTCTHRRVRAHSAHKHTCSRTCTRVHPQALTEPRSPQRHVQDADGAVHYVLLSAPWAVLCCYAEDLRLKLPLQVRGARGAEGPGGAPPATQGHSWLLPKCRLQCLRLTTWALQLQSPPAPGAPAGEGGAAQHGGTGGRDSR